tara:strand:- start:208 stop:675 length:468 start_codon:yes stop_codon:yes gene_type:complete
MIDVARLAPNSINRVHDGISIADVFENEIPRRDKPLGFRANDGRAWLDNDWKLLQNVLLVDGELVTGPFELYNIIGDPGEEYNLIELYPEVADRMRQQLDSWSVSVSRSALGADYPEGEVLPSGRDEEPVITERREMRMKEWAEEVRLSEVRVLP